MFIDWLICQLDSEVFSPGSFHVCNSDPVREYTTIVLGADHVQNLGRFVRMDPEFGAVIDNIGPGRYVFKIFNMRYPERIRFNLPRYVAQIADCETAVRIIESKFIVPYKFAILKVYMCGVGGNSHAFQQLDCGANRDQIVL